MNINEVESEIIFMLLCQNQTPIPNFEVIENPIQFIIKTCDDIISFDKEGCNTNVLGRAVGRMKVLWVKRCCEQFGELDQDRITNSIKEHSLGDCEGSIFKFKVV